MNHLKMTDAIGLIDDQLISEAITFHGTKKKTDPVKWGAIAACLCLVVIGAVAAWGPGFRNDRYPAETEDTAAVVQVSLVNKASASESEAAAAVHLVSVKDGLCLAADSGTTGSSKSKEIAIFVAPEDTQDRSAESMSLEEAKRLAYLDLDSAADEMKKRILEARRIIIFSSSWVADGFSGCVQNVKTGEIIRTLPTFSELFPGWDMPELPNASDQITADGLGADCLYGLSMRIIAVNETSVRGALQGSTNMFDADTEITVALPENTTALDLGLKIGDTVFVSYYGSGCSLSERFIEAYAVEKTDPAAANTGNSG